MQNQKKPFFASISLGNINFYHKWNIHPFLDDTPANELIASINSNGLIHPPIITQISSEQYEIINGRKRISALLHLDSNSSCLCLVIPQSFPAESTLSILLDDNMSKGRLSPVEIGWFLRIALSCLPRKEINRLFLKKIGIKHGSATFDASLSVTEFSTRLQRAIHSNDTSLKIGIEINKLVRNEQDNILDIFDYLRMGGGKQRRFLALLKDSAYSSGKDIITTLKESVIQDIIKHPEMNSPQKTNYLLSHLQDECFPRSSAREKLFKKQIKELNLPKNYSINHTPSFETDEVTLKISFPVLEELKKFVSPFIQGNKSHH